MAEKMSAGDLAIAAASKPGSTNAQFRKALWSIRGDLKVRFHDRFMTIVRADLVQEISNLIAEEKGDEPSGFMLVQGENFWELKLSKVKASKKETEVQE